MLFRVLLSLTDFTVSVSVEFKLEFGRFTVVGVVVVAVDVLRGTMPDIGIANGIAIGDVVDDESVNGLVRLIKLS